MMMVRWFRQLLQSPDRWAMMYIPPQQVAQLYQVNFDGSLTRALLEGDTSLGWKSLQVAYPTVKRKCFITAPTFGRRERRTSQTQTSHTCEKRSHSWYCNVGRAIKGLLTRCTRFGRYPDLYTRPQTIRESLLKLSPFTPGQQCDCCSRIMSSPSLMTYHAGQAFEMLSPDTFLADLNHLLQLAARSDILRIQALHIAKLVAGRTNTLRRDLGDRVLYEPQSIPSCVAAHLSMRYYRFGKRFLDRAEESRLVAANPESSTI